MALSKKKKDKLEFDKRLKVYLEVWPYGLEVKYDRCSQQEKDAVQLWLDEGIVSDDLPFVLKQRLAR
jgi:hypothetical protein